MEKLITVEGLSKRYGKDVAVDDLSFQIQKGSCTALLGPNGAGKTTTLKMLAGLLSPSSGKIEFEEMSEGDLRKYIGYLPQYPVFYNWMSASEFLTYVARLAFLSKKEAVVRTNELLELVGLEDARDRRIGNFSGGMKQRLGIAQAMIHSPKLVMLDEPVSALDPVGRRDVIDMLEELKKQTTILFSTHVLSDAEEVCDDILIIRGGKMALSGSLQELRERYQKDVITVQVKGDGGAWVKKLESYDWVLDVTLEGGLMTLVVDEVESAREKILREIVDLSIPVVSFSVGQSSLEELFMKVVRA